MKTDAIQAAALPQIDGRPVAQNPKEAAVQFEALLIGQLLKNARASGEGGWLGSGEDQASSTMMEVAEEHLAQVLASQGGLGIANLVVQSLESKSE